MRISRIVALISVCALVIGSTSIASTADEGDAVQLVRQAIFAKPSSDAPEISTRELEQILQDGSAAIHQMLQRLDDS
jgi:hypothetical protein